MRLPLYLFLGLRARTLKADVCTDTDGQNSCHDVNLIAIDSPSTMVCGVEICTLSTNTSLLQTWVWVMLIARG